MFHLAPSPSYLHFLGDTDVIQGRWYEVKYDICV
jgi:hypothetical protein